MTDFLEISINCALLNFCHGIFEIDRPTSTMNIEIVDSFKSESGTDVEFFLGLILKNENNFFL